MHQKLVDQGHANTEAALGRKQSDKGGDKEYGNRLEDDPAWAQAEVLYSFCNRIGLWVRILPGDRPGYLRAETDHWCATIVKGRLHLHPPDVPVLVWAVSLGPGGITWAEAEVTKVTARNVVVRYGGEAARLDRRQLWRWWSFWRGVRFVSSRTGRIATELDQIWQRRYGTAGNVTPSMQMPLADARAMLGVLAD